MSGDLSRRSFARRLVAVSSAGAGLSVEPLAVGAASGAVDAPCAAQDVPPGALPPPDDLLLGALLQRYPSEHFTPRRIAGIQNGLRRILAQSDLLRRVPLDNSDAPAMVFQAWRAAD